MKNIEFVIAAYGIWCGAMVLYLGYLWRKSRNARNGLQRLRAARAGSASQPS